MLRAFPRLPGISRGVLALLLVAVSLRADAATLYDPILRFRSVRTEHFVIYFHQGEEPLAARLATIAEEVWSRVGTALELTAPRRTHVVLADQSELANGWATPLPYNTILLTAAAPTGSEFIGSTSDWLRLVFTHEFTHIVHLDQSEGWAKVFRGIFGRTAIAFPNLWLPGWQIEGLAEWEESALTGEGRLHAGDFRAIEREAARDQRIEPLDRVNGGLTDWPGGLAQYAFGLGFHQYLATTFGEWRFAELAAQTSRSVPLFGSRAFAAVYGQSLSDLWRNYQDALSSSVPPRSQLSTAPTPVRLTHHGFTVLAPRFVPTRCSGCPDEIVYSVRNPDGFPELRAIGVDGSGSRRLTTRYLGSTVGFGEETIVFDQQELRRNTGLYSDLYMLDRRTEDVRRLTHDARLQDPDLSPDGESIICVRQNGGQRDLMLVRLKPDTTSVPRTDVTSAAVPRADVVSGFSRTVGEVDVLIAEADTSFDAPRWSPDGRSVVVEQHRRGAEAEIVVVDIATRTGRVIASAPSARIVTPTWTPDGRAVVAAADFDGDTFNLYEFSVTTQAAPRQLTHTSGGATWPDVSADGRLIAFAGYTSDGFDVFTLPYPDAVPEMATEGLPASSASPVAASGPALTSRRYSPWSTLTPTSWTPIIESDAQLRAGLGTSGFDVLGRHGYAVSATWLIDRPDTAPAFNPAVPDWRVDYSYDRWRPTVFASASSDTLFAAGGPDSRGRPLPATLRQRNLEVGVFTAIRHVRSTQRAHVSVIRTMDRLTTRVATLSGNRAAARIAVAASTAHLYGYSISREDGLSVGATSEVARRDGSSSIDATAFTVDGRAYLPGLARHHVLALRASGGRSSGALEARRTFLLGGAAPDGDVIDFSREAVSLLRGFAPNTFAGSRVALVNGDYRWPVARPQRGLGAWPIFLQTVHAAVFADVGDAWTDRFSRRDLKTSLGGELSLDLIGGYAFPITTTIGAAWGHDSTDASNRGAVYVRIGRAF